MIAPPVMLGRVAERAALHGRDAMAFLAVESSMQHWFDTEAPEGTGACVAYVDTSGAWVAACSPLIAVEGPTHASEVDRAALRFAEAAHANGRRACFFGCEAPDQGGMARLLIGEQPILRPREWMDELPRHRRLREQLRRARAKGVRVRAVAPEELAVGAPLRLAIELLAEQWLCSRHIEPMGFLAALEPFHHPAMHRYFVAERRGVVTGFLSAVPTGGRRAWLVEDVARSADAPNGTTESLIVGLMRDVLDSEYVTLGLTPLAGDVAWPLRVARWISRPLFDFEGLRAFRGRLHPQAWKPVWLLYPRGQSPLRPLLDSLRAFARGSLLGFAMRSFVRHPSGPAWALALPLPLWTAGLAWLVATRRASLLGFPTGELALWTVFDALLLLVLVNAAMRPRRSWLLLAMSLAVLDAILSLAHLSEVGLGSTKLQASLRGTATMAPLVGAFLLTWATTRTSSPRASPGKSPTA